MAIRIPCPACEASLSVDEEKRGKKIRCPKCSEVFAIPLGGSKRRDDDDKDAVQEGNKVKAKGRPRDEDAVQDGRKIKAKARPRDDDDDDDPDERRSRGKTKNKGGAPVLLLVLGGVGTFLLLLVVGGGVGAYFLIRSSDNKAANAADRPGRMKPIAVENKPAEAAAPIAKVDPKPNVALNVGRVMGDRMTDETVARVKQATVYIKVTMANGLVGSGSGFLAVEPEMVITNAHVVGMLQSNGQPPRQVEVYLNSGQANEVKMIGKLLGVDRASDLAVIKVDNKNLPPPLPIEAEKQLTELQKVYVFGFPLGEQLGKAITVTEASVSSFRPDKSGELEHIQIQGSMQPGNSGGPVLNANGSIVGVAVAIIKGTQINFAIPAFKINQVMAGRAMDTRLRQPYKENGQTKLPVQIACLDPLKKISEVKLDVWTGLPGQPRPASKAQPTQHAGDGARQSHAVTYTNGVGTVDVALPAAPTGQVYWMQPVVTNSTGTHWGAAIPAPLNLQAVERKPANLTANFTTTKERTVQLKSSQGLNIFVKDEEKQLFANTMDMSLLEAIVVEPSDSTLQRVRAIYGKTKLTTDVGGKSILMRPPVVDMLRQVAPIYLVDNSNSFKKRVDRLLHPQMEKRLREDTQNSYNQLCTSLELVMLNVPNRLVKPLETWDTKLPLILRGGPGAMVVDMACTCTYEGVQIRDKREEGIISVRGRILPRAKQTANISGDVEGKIGFDVVGGFISYGKVKVNTASTLAPPPGSQGGDLPANDYIEVELTRKAGNTANITFVPEKKEGFAGGPPIVPTGRILVNAGGFLAPNDPLIAIPNDMIKQSRYKFQNMKMEAGKTYVITLDSAAFDAYLILQDAKGKTIAEDDDSGGGPPDHPLNARLEFRCTQTGMYRIVMTSFDGHVGPFQFKVQEAQ